MTPMKPGSTSCGDALVEAARSLNAAVDSMRFAAPVSHVYNPLDYAWAPTALPSALRRGRKRVIFVAANPAPSAWCRPIVLPFSEIDTVRDWRLGLEAGGRPACQENPETADRGLRLHPLQESAGDACGGLFRERFGSPEAFFAEHYVANYCPLAFFDGGRNLKTNCRWPNPHRSKPPATLICAAWSTAARTGWVIGVGAAAEGCASQAALAGTLVVWPRCT